MTWSFRNSQKWTGSNLVENSNHSPKCAEFMEENFWLFALMAIVQCHSKSSFWVNIFVVLRAKVSNFQHLNIWIWHTCTGQQWIKQSTGEKHLSTHRQCSTCQLPVYFCHVQLSWKIYKSNRIRVFGKSHEKPHLILRHPNVHKSTSQKHWSLAEFLRCKLFVYLEKLRTTLHNKPQFGWSIK